MRYLRVLITFIFFTSLILPVRAQNVLPDFSVKELARGKIQVSWNNPFTSDCIQLAVQRSMDSVKDFRTIYSAQSPELPSNGFVDNKQLYINKRYYRIFYVLSGGAYYFTKPILLQTKPFAIGPYLPKVEPGQNWKIENYILESINPRNLIRIYIKKTEAFTLSKEEYKRFRDSINTKTKDGLRKINDYAIEWNPAHIPGQKDKLISIYKRVQLLVKLTDVDFTRFKDSIAKQTQDTLFAIDELRIQLHPFIPNDTKYIFVYKNNVFIEKLELLSYKKFKDSIALKSKDTLFAIDNNHLDIHPYIPRYVWRPSLYVFTNAKGYVSIALPLVKQHRYRVIFYDEDASELFQLKSIKETELVLDKTNFMHAGWFSFELFEDDKLREKSKFFLSRD